MRFWVAIAVGLGGCAGSDDVGCEGWDEVFVYSDADGDGFGTDRVGWVCAPAANQSVTAGDCDDADATSFPSAAELCDAVDNDCNGRVDDGIALVTWYRDDDADGFGGRASEPSCAAPDPAWIARSGDCDDDDEDVNPSVREVCNDADDDCDGRRDDEDDGIDPTTQTLWYRDTDEDGYGDIATMVSACDAPTAVFITQGGDCDDTRAIVNPDGHEICNLHDDDCDTLVDDDDDSIDPAGQSEFFSDADLDGYGNPDELTLACRPIPGAVTNGDDCDDTEATATVVRDWFDDADFDGVGAGPVIATECLSPGFGTAPSGDDCNDADPEKFPGNPEICEDGLDQDCSGEDRVCATWLYTVREQGDVLQRFDTLTLTLEDVGPLGTPFDYGDLAYDPASHTMYMSDGFGGQGLFTVDLLTGQATLVGFHNLGDLFGLAWDPTTGTLYGSEYLQIGLWTLDPDTAVPTLVGNPPVGFGALAWDTTRDQLLGMADGFGDLYVIDPSNGSATFLTNGGWTNDSGMAYDPQDDLVWGIDGSGTIYNYDPNDNYARTDVLLNQGSHNGFVYVPDPPN